MKKEFFWKITPRTPTGREIGVGPVCVLADSGRRAPELDEQFYFRLESDDALEEREQVLAVCRSERWRAEKVMTDGEGREYTGDEFARMVTETGTACPRHAILEGVVCERCGYPR
jgi:hypothetical protein